MPEGDGVRVRFKAKDEASTIKEAAVSLNGEAWLNVLPEDGIFDQLEESFDVLIPKPLVRGDQVMVKVADACGNEQSASILVGETKRR
jgi:hypothetical protein